MNTKKVFQKPKLFTLFFNFLQIIMLKKILQTTLVLATVFTALPINTRAATPISSTQDGMTYTYNESTSELTYQGDFKKIPKTQCQSNIGFARSIVGGAIRIVVNYSVTDVNAKSDDFCTPQNGGNGFIGQYGLRKFKLTQSEITDFKANKLFVKSENPQLSKEDQAILKVQNAYLPTARFCAIAPDIRKQHSDYLASEDYKNRVKVLNEIMEDESGTLSQKAIEDGKFYGFDDYYAVLTAPYNEEVEVDIISFGKAKGIATYPDGSYIVEGRRLAGLTASAKALRKAQTKNAYKNSVLAKEKANLGDPGRLAPARIKEIAKFNAERAKILKISTATVDFTSLFNQNYTSKDYDAFEKLLDQNMYGSELAKTNILYKRFLATGKDASKKSQAINDLAFLVNAPVVFRKDCSLRNQKKAVDEIKGLNAARVRLGLSPISTKLFEKIL